MLNHNTMSESSPLLPSNPASPSTSNAKSSPQEPSPDYHYGYRLMALSTIGTSTGTFFLHIALALYALPVRTALLIRAIVQTTFALSHFLLNPVARRTLSTLTPGALIWLALRGFLGAIAMALYFYALKLLPVGDAATIVYLHPMFAMLIAHMALKEHASVLELAAAALSVAGVFLIAHTNDPAVQLVDGHSRIMGSLFALASAFGAAIAFVIVRGLGLSINFMSSLLSLGVMYVLVALCMGGEWGFGERGMWKGAIIAILAGVCGFSGQCYTNKGLQHCPAGSGQVVRSVGVAMTYALGVVFLGEGIGIRRLCGAALVIGAAGVVGWSRSKSERN